MRYSLRTLLIVLVILGPLMLASCVKAADENSVFSSPVTVFDAYREARNKRDWRRCFALLTSEALDDAVFEAFFSSAESQSKKARDIVKRYVDENTMKSEIEKERMRIAKDNTKLDLRGVLAKAVKDKAGFCADMSEVFAPDPVPPLGELRNLKVDGDTAKGQVATTSWHISGDGKGASKKVVDEIEKTFEFKRIDGRWLIHAR